MGQLVTPLSRFINSGPMNLSGKAHNKGRCKIQCLLEASLTPTLRHTFLSVSDCNSDRKQLLFQRDLRKHICLSLINVVALFYNFVPHFLGDSGHPTLFKGLLGLTEPPHTDRAAHEKSLNQLHLSQPALTRDFIYLKSRY